MVSNPLVFAIGALLAAGCFLIPKLLRSRRPISRALAVVALYAAVFAGFLTIGDFNTAIAVVTLGAVFATIAEALAINYRMVHNPVDPKHRRCY